MFFHITIHAITKIIHENIHKEIAQSRVADNKYSNSTLSSSMTMTLFIIQIYNISCIKSRYLALRIIVACRLV